MRERISIARPPRLVSLDAFRGITIAGMILVNNPGSWGYVYSPLRHARWHGWTPTDLVFPFFLFIVGVAMAFSFQRRLTEPRARSRLFVQVVRRTLILFLLGLIMAGFPDFRLIGPQVLAVGGVAMLTAERPLISLGRIPVTHVQKLVGAAVLAGAAIYFTVDVDHFHAQKQRVPGVLQRIAVCYFIASVAAMALGTRGRAVLSGIILLGYWVIVATAAPPAGYTAAVTGPEGLLHDWVDVQLLAGHLYGERPDPEGLLSTLPAVATVLLGMLVGQWLQAARDSRDKAIGLFFVANVALVLAAWWHLALPINKKIWTSSYVILTAGLAMHFLAMCYWLIDVRGYRRWAWPFVVFGSNAIVVYFASSLVAKLLGRWKFMLPDGTTTSAKRWIYENVLASWAGEFNGSLLYALSYILLWLLLLIPLYRRRIFVKI